MAANIAKPFDKIGATQSSENLPNLLFKMSISKPAKYNNLVHLCLLNILTPSSIFTSYRHGNVSQIGTTPRSTLALLIPQYSSVNPAWCSTCQIVMARAQSTHTPNYTSASPVHRPFSSPVLLACSLTIQTYRDIYSLFSVFVRDKQPISAESMEIVCSQGSRLDFLACTSSPRFLLLSLNVLYSLGQMSVVTITLSIYLSIYLSQFSHYQSHFLIYLSIYLSICECTWSYCLYVDRLFQFLNQSIYLSIYLSITVFSLSVSYFNLSIDLCIYKCAWSYCLYLDRLSQF